MYKKIMFISYAWKAKKYLLKLYGTKLMCINGTAEIMCTDLCS